MGKEGKKASPKRVGNAPAASGGGKPRGTPHGVAAWRRGGAAHALAGGRAPKGGGERKPKSPRQPRAPADPDALAKDMESYWAKSDDPKLKVPSRARARQS